MAHPPTVRPRSTARSGGSPCRRSSRWSPSRCSCSPTRPSSATSAPPQLAGLGVAAAVLQTLVGHLRLPRLRHHRERRPAARAPATAGRRSAQGIDGVWLAVAHRGRRHRGGRRRHRPARPAVRRRARRWPTRPTTYLRIAFLGTTPLLVMLADHRRAARPPGHPHARSSSRSRGNAPEHRAQPAARLRRRLLRRHRASPARRSARCSPSSPAPPPCSPSWSAAPGGRAPRCAPTCPGIRARGPRRACALVIRTVTLRAALLLTTYAVVLGADGPTADQSVSVADPPAGLHDLDASWPSPSTPSPSPRRRSPGATSARATARAPAR